MLTGTYARSVDDKGRVAIPKPLRDVIRKTDGQATLFVAPGTDGSLTIYTEEAFAKLAEKLADASPTGQDVRDFSRLFYSRAQRAELDKQGRIRIPPELGQLISLGKDAVLVGVWDRLELWNSATWHDYLAQRHARYDEIAERAFATPPDVT